MIDSYSIILLQLKEIQFLSCGFPFLSHVQVFLILDELITQFFFPFLSSKFWCSALSFHFFDISVTGCSNLSFFDFFSFFSYIEFSNRWIFSQSFKLSTPLSLSFLERVSDKGICPNAYSFVEISAALFGFKKFSCSSVVSFLTFFLMVFASNIFWYLEFSFSPSFLMCSWLGSSIPSVSFSYINCMMPFLSPQFHSYILAVYS